MRKDYEKLFAHFTPQEPPAGLLDRIFARIRLEEELLSMQKRLVFFSSLALVSVAAFVPTVNMFRSEFAQSGFYEFIALFFSDAGSIAASWQDFGFALLESLPATSTIALLITILTFFWSSQRIVHTIKVVFYSPQVIQ